MFTPMLCPTCTAIVIVPEHGAGRRCPCCSALVGAEPEPTYGELVPLPVRRLRRDEAA